MIATPGLGLHLLQQVQILRLNGDVQRRRGFVGNQQAGRARHADGTAHPLPHAAAKLVHIMPQPRLGSGDT
jgi:hypothetical protein